jgi:hypothetical protein
VNEDFDDDFRDPRWRSTVLGAKPADVLALPIVRYVQIKMTPEIATLATRIAKQEGLSREGWMREVITDALAAASGLSRAEIARGMRPGTYNRDTRPAGRRHDGP